MAWKALSEELDIEMPSDGRSEARADHVLVVLVIVGVFKSS